MRVVELLLTAGAGVDVNTKAGVYGFALPAAAAEKQRDILEALLAAGADRLAFSNLTKVGIRLRVMKTCIWSARARSGSRAAPRLREKMEED